MKHLPRNIGTSTAALFLLSCTSPSLAESTPTLDSSSPYLHQQIYDCLTHSKGKELLKPASKSFVLGDHENPSFTVEITAQPYDGHPSLVCSVRKAYESKILVLGDGVGDDSAFDGEPDWVSLYSLSPDPKTPDKIEYTQVQDYHKEIYRLVLLETCKALGGTLAEKVNLGLQLGQTFRK